MFNYCVKGRVSCFYEKPQDLFLSYFSQLDILLFYSFYPMQISKILVWYKEGPARPTFGPKKHETSGKFSPDEIFAVFEGKGADERGGFAVVAASEGEMLFGGFGEGKIEQVQVDPRRTGC